MMMVTSAVFASRFRCGQETRVIPRLLQMRSHWVNSPKENQRLEEAGLHRDVSDE